MTNFSACIAPYGSIFLSQVMPCTIYASVSIFSTIMTSAPSIVVPSKYCLYKLFSWIEWFWSTFACLMNLLLAFMTFTFKFWFLLAFISLVTMLILVVALSIEFFLFIAPTFVWCVTYLPTVIASRFLIPFGTLFGRVTFFLISKSYFTFFPMKIFLILLI